LLDHGYHPEHLTIELQNIYQQIMTAIKFELLENYYKISKINTVKMGIYSGKGNMDN